MPSFSITRRELVVVDGGEGDDLVESELAEAERQRRPPRPPARSRGPSAARRCRQPTSTQRVHERRRPRRRGEPGERRCTSPSRSTHHSRSRARPSGRSPGRQRRRTAARSSSGPSVAITAGSALIAAHAGRSASVEPRSSSRSVRSSGITPRRRASQRRPHRRLGHVRDDLDARRPVEHERQPAVSAFLSRPISATRSSAARPVGHGRRQAVRVADDRPVLADPVGVDAAEACGPARRRRPGRRRRPRRGSGRCSVAISRAWASVWP